MKRILVFTALLALLPLTALLGQTRKLTMEEAVLPYNHGLWPTTLSGLQFRPHSDEYSFIEGERLVVKSVAGVERVSLRLSDINRQLRASDTLRAIHGYRWEGREQIALWSGKTKFLYKLSDGSVRPAWKLVKQADNIHESPRHEAIAYNIGQTIKIETAEGKSFTVIKEEADGITHGRSVHQNEFGINGGMFWSPEGGKLAFYRMDERMVAEYPLVATTAHPAAFKPFRYPMAGTPSHHVTIGIYSNLKEQGEVVWLKTEEPKEQYLTNVTWAKNGSSIYVCVLNRGQDTMRLNKYNPNTGELIATLFTETHPKYMEPLKGPHFLPDGRFLWQSQRSGHNHLYLYDSVGKLIRPVTQGEWDVFSLEGTDRNGRNAFIVSNEHGLLERHLVGVDIENGQRKKLTNRQGYHQVLVDFTNDRFLASWTAPQDAGGVYLGQLRGGNSFDLYKAKNPLEGFDMPVVEKVSIKAADGKTDLYGRLLRPKNLEEGKQYPTIVYVYGGPHAQLVADSWLYGTRYWELYMAQNGYVVFILDSRGSHGRGFAFEQPIHRQLGELELADQLEGVKYLQSLPYVDKERMGVHGWSYGGFMSMSLLLRGNDNFKVAVSGGPVTDWRLYEIMYGERYMDHPRENPEGYARADLSNYVNALKGKHLLLIHGAMDNVVVPQHTFTFLQACIEAGRTEVDCFFYPTHPHNVRGKDRVHLMNKVTRYFDEYLK